MGYSLILFIHILAGLTAILTGFIALSLKKGGRYHRKVGFVFTIAMTIMATGAAYLGFTALEQDIGDVVTGSMTIYLVLTAWMAVKRKEGQIGTFEYVSFLVAAGGATLFFWGAINSVRDGTALHGGIPAFIFASVIALAALLDLRVILTRGLYGTQRIIRHVWRMCMALFIAVGSFFLGQMQIFPEELQKIEIVSLPVIAVVVIMLYWIFRILFTGWYNESLTKP